LSPTRDELSHISAVSGIEIERIRSLTMARYRQHAEDVDPWTCQFWPRRAGSRFCPRCLRESGGRWALAWRLNWSFACVKHWCMLADSCPVCHSAARRQPLCASRIPRLGRCPRIRSYRVAQTAVPCDADLGSADVLLLPSTHSVLSAQTTVAALLDKDRADFALYSGGTTGRGTALSDIRLLAQWIMCAVEQAKLDHYLPADISNAVLLHRQSTWWPYGRYWRSARVVPSALDTAVGVSLALRVISLPKAAAALVLQQLMENASNGGPYRRPIARGANLASAVSSVLDVAYTRNNADRKLRSRLARKLASSQSGLPSSSVMAR
jgi:TniQ